MFNEDLLTQYREPQFKRQYMNPALLLDIINKAKKYKVEEIWNYRKWGHSIQFLIHWKEYRNKHVQWIFETELLYAKKAIENY